MASKTRDRTPTNVEADVRRLLGRSIGDDQLRAELEELAHQWAFTGLTWLWGPELYRRNRVLFGPFILAHFSSTVLLKKRQWEAVAWQGKVGEVLERWLAEVDRNDDVDLFRRLYQWKILQGNRGRLNVPAVVGDLLRRIESAPTAAVRAVVLEKFNIWLELDEPGAIRLYTVDPANSAAYILRHIPLRWAWAGEKRVLWHSLFELARRRGDHAFAMQLYRRQVPLDRWEADGHALCRTTADASALCVKLDEHHPQGWGLELGARIARLVESRGRDIVPYVLKHLKDIWPRFLRHGGYAMLLDRAYTEGWWDLWSGLLRVCAQPDEWNKVVRRLVTDHALCDAEAARRLLLLTGVAREWNFGGFSMAFVRQLDDDTALAVYERFPELVRGPFKLHLQTGLWTALPKLIRRVVAKDDEMLIDFMASRLINRARSDWAVGKPLEDLMPLADYFESLRDRDPALFASRAANVLTQVPAFTLGGYDRTLRDNRLARLLLERSLESFLNDPKALCDLIEASEIHVQHLAFRVLGLDDDRARAAAA